MENYFRQLHDMLGTDAALPFLKDFTSGLKRNPVNCLHQAFLPDGQSPCFSVGVAELGKAMGIRKTVVTAAAARYCGLPAPETGTSTKIRVHQLFYLASAESDKELKNAIELMEKKTTVLLHLCGHGICSESRPLACVNPEHLVMGSQEVNVKHTGAHEVLALAATKEEYNLLLRVYERNPAFNGVF